MEIFIDPEFRELIPALSAHERAGFEKSIARDGCRDPLAVWDNLESHPVADIFPLLEGQAFEQFKQDIAENGLRESIWLHEGRIIDGRNRYRACLETGTAPTFREWEGNGSLVAFVISLNLHRRHLNESQRAMVAARLANLPDDLIEHDLKSLAAIERWSREREIAEINNGDGSWDEKQNRIAVLKDGWKRKDRTSRLHAARQLYVAFAGDLMKIGISSLPEGRIESLKVGHPDIRLLKCWPGGFADEKKVQELLVDFARGGEWFAYSEESFQIVCRYMQNRQVANVHVPAKNVAAAALNVGARSIDRGRAVLDRGTPELIAAVDAGRIAVSAAAQIAERPEEQQREAVNQVVRLNVRAPNVIRDLNRQDRFGELIKAGTPNTEGVGKFAVIYSDPPWRYESIGIPSRAIENHYPTMSLDEICALNVGDMALPDCVLFLWATSPKLDEAMTVIKTWGFTYRTCAIWDKEIFGLGYYFRLQHELLLVAIKGHPPKPHPSARVSSVIRSRRGAHSVKPTIVYEIIERMYPELPKLELFQRASRAGWTGWGNQANAVA